MSKKFISKYSYRLCINFDIILTKTSKMQDGLAFQVSNICKLLKGDTI